MLARSQLRAAVAGLVLAGLVLSAAPGVAGPAVVPPRLRDVHGGLVEVAALAAQHRLVFVTVKATWCPVCRQQLQRLARLLPELHACNVHFVVLVPGSNEAVATIARETSLPFPFVLDNRGGVAAAAGFAATPDELVPGFFVVNAARQVVWQQRGRADGAYGDAALLDYLGCEVPDRGPDILARLN